MTGSPVLLYDGECGFCAESVQMVLRHERRRTLRFAPLQGRYAAEIRSRHPELTSVDSMLWVESREGGEHVFARSGAALHVAGYLGGVWRVLLLGYLLPVALRDGLYDFIARHRHELPGGARATCVVVPPDQRQRFLD